MMRNMDRFGMLFDLTGHVAVVTGAAQGNGAGIANALYDAGAVVIATDIAFTDEVQRDRNALYPEIIRNITVWGLPLCNHI